MESMEEKRLNCDTQDSKERGCQIHMLEGTLAPGL